jgi:hypothetical protein
MPMLSYVFVLCHEALTVGTDINEQAAKRNIRHLLTVTLFLWGADVGFIVDALLSLASIVNDTSTVPHQPYRFVGHREPSWGLINCSSLFVLPRLAENYNLIFLGFCRPKNIKNIKKYKKFLPIRSY